MSFLELRAPTNTLRIAIASTPFVPNYNTFTQLCLLDPPGSITIALLLQKLPIDYPHFLEAYSMIGRYPGCGDKADTSRVSVLLLEHPYL